MLAVWLPLGEAAPPKRPGPDFKYGKWTHVTLVWVPGGSSHSEDVPLEPQE